jgi:hypothetical protein
MYIHILNVQYIQYSIEQKVILIKLKEIDPYIHGYIRKYRNYVKQDGTENIRMTWDRM